jgi:hypothetical protein
MAKKKKTIELSSQNIEFTQDGSLYKIIKFYPSNMTVDVMLYENGVKQKMSNIPFAHLPKEVKKIVKPN